MRMTYGLRTKIGKSKSGAMNGTTSMMRVTGRLSNPIFSVSMLIIRGLRATQIRTQQYLISTRLTMHYGS